MQAYTEYLLQARHFVYSVGKPAFVDEEVYKLDDLYGTRHPQSSTDLVRQVRFAKTARCQLFPKRPVFAVIKVCHGKMQIMQKDGEDVPLTNEGSKYWQDVQRQLMDTGTVMSSQSNVAQLKSASGKYIRTWRRKLSPRSRRKPQD